MKFTNEYHTLSNIKHHSILEMEYSFHAQIIKIYFNNHSDNKFLILVCELEEGTLVRNLAFYQIGNEYHINSYWGKYYPYVKNTLVNHSDYKFSDFFNSIRRAIDSINTSNPSVSSKLFNQSEGIEKIGNATSTSFFPNDSIYYNHVRRQKMTEAQFTKVSNILGLDAANYLKKLNLNAVFVKDIRRQKSFILEE